MNWAVGARPVSRPCGVYSFDGSDDPDVGRWRNTGARKATRDDAERQGCGDLRSRRRDRRGCRARICARGAEVFLPGDSGRPWQRSPAKSSRPVDPQRRRSRCSDEQAVDRHLQSVIDTAGRVDISFNAVGISNAKAPVCLWSSWISSSLAADHELHHVVLPDSTPGRQTDGPEQIGGDHDRYRTPRADRHRIERRVRFRAGRQGGTHARPIHRTCTSGYPRGQPATTRHAGDRDDEGSFRAQSIPHGNNLGTVPNFSRKLESPATGHDARGSGKHGGVYRFRQGERDDRNHRELDHGGRG